MAIVFVLILSITALYYNIYSTTKDASQLSVNIGEDKKELYQPKDDVNVTLEGNLCQNILNETSALKKHLLDGETNESISLKKWGFTGAVNYENPNIEVTDDISEHMGYYEKYEKYKFIPKTIIDKFESHENISLIEPQEYKNKVENIDEIENFDISVIDYMLDIKSNTGLKNKIPCYKFVSMMKDVYHDSIIEKFKKTIIKDKTLEVKNPNMILKLANRVNWYKPDTITVSIPNFKILVGEDVVELKHTFDEYVELQTNPNMRISAVVLREVDGGYLIVTSW
jgi:hypothetical protein